MWIAIGIYIFIFAAIFLFFGFISLPKKKGLSLPAFQGLPSRPVLRTHFVPLPIGAVFPLQQILDCANINRHYYGRI